MRRPLKFRAIVAVGVAAALSLAACSDPTNPEPENTADAGATSASQGSAGETAATDSADDTASGADATAETAGSEASGSEGTGETAASGGEAGGEGATGEPAEPGQAAADASGTVNLFMYQKPEGHFNPLAPASGPDNNVISLMYEGLMTQGPDGVLVPLLADGQPEVSEDAKTVTYHIKEGLTWSDGEPLTSEDVLYTMQLAADPNMVDGPGSGTVFADVEGRDEFGAGKADSISGFSAPDDHTFQVTLSRPNVGYVNSKASQYGIMPKHIIESLDVAKFTDDPYFQKPTVGSGPFIFSEYQTDQFVHLTANPNYRYKVGVKDVFLKILTSDVATQQLQTGEIDGTVIAPVDLETVEGFDGVSVTPVETYGFVRAAWNQSKERFADPKVKQAFLYGTDRKSIVDGALKGQATVRNSAFGDPWVSPELNDYPYDPEKAKQLLEEAGWDSSKPVDLAWISEGNPDRDAAAAVMQDQLKNIGITINLNPIQASWITENVPTAKFDMFIYGGGNYTANPADVIPITACQEPGKGANNGLYCNKEFEAMLDEANQTPDAAKAKQMYQDASLIENEDPSQMWLFTPKTIWAVSDKLEGFQPTPQAENWYQAWEWKKAA